MQNKVRLFVILAFGVSWFVTRHQASTSTIDYQGQSIKLKKSYASYEDYKDDPDNLALSEVSRVQALVQAAPISKRFSDRAAMTRAIFEIKFPGYGCGFHGETPLADGSKLTLVDVEIPHANKNRYLTFLVIGGQYSLVDDFVQAEGIGTVAITEDKLVYSTSQGKKVVERTPPVKLPPARP